MNKLTSIYDHVKAAFKKVFDEIEQETPKVDQVASTALAVAAPLLTTALALTGNAPAAAEAQSVISKIQSDMAQASALIEAGGTDTSLPGLLTSIKTDLPTILTVAQVKDPKTVATITGITDSIIATIEGVEADLPTPEAEQQNV